MEYYSAMKKKKIMPFALTWKDLDIIILSKVSQTGERNIIWYPLYVESKKKWYKQNYLQNRNRLTDLENELMVIRVKDIGKGELGSLGLTFPHSYAYNQQGPDV